MPSPLMVAAMLLAATPVAVGEQIYKWIDASGNVTYSSTPPPDAAAQADDQPASPPPGEIEAARDRERSLQELGDQLSQERQDREAQLAEERKAARAEAALQPPVQPLQESGVGTDDGWWVPAYPGYGPGVRPPLHPPVLPGRPVKPPPGRDPTQPPDHPAYWPREPLVPPDDAPPPPPRPAPLPRAR
jgi:hypothetical protein